MHGSASTWIFNAAREMLNAVAGETAVLPCFADKMAHLPPEAARAGKTLVIKSHEGSAALDEWLHAQGALLLLSVRDPRDATLSLMQRFGMGLQPAAHAIMRDGLRLQHRAAGGAPLWRYEDGFFKRPDTLDEIAARLGLPLPATLRTEIFTRYGTEAVREFARHVASLPPERITMVGPFAMDRVTQILTPHVGDGASGKWRALPPPLPAQLSGFFAPLLSPFGYAA